MYTLSKNKKFMFLLGAELFSVLGYSMFLLTISWYVVDQLKQPQYMGLLLAVASLPRMFTMIVGGVMADRIQKSKILFSTGIAKTILIGVLLYAYLGGNLTFAILLVVSFLLGCLDGLFFPALSSLIPALVEKKELQGANTMIHSSQELVFLIGPVLAGALINYYSFSIPFIISMISMFIYSLLVFPAIIKDEKPLSTGEKSTVFRELQEGYNYVRTSPLYIVGIGIIIVINFFIFGPLFLSLPLLAKEEGGTALHLSFLEAGFSIGSLVATVVLLIVTLHKNRGKLTLYSLITSAILMCVFSQIPSIWGLIPMVSLIGFLGFMTFIPTDVMIQENTDPKMMGRVMGIVFLAQTAFDPISQTLFSFLMTLGISVRYLLFGFASIGVVFSLFIFMKAKNWRMMH
ncbi:MFS transporter [Priestia filamentosa]|uniref:MFS transporter n=2 Tax=Priestia filamentosa TaxID=1402861 RepID=UPI0002EE8BE0|nr:MFS transporter [Priestia filamentosa]RJS64463.1 MFS transporter [Priestia filamentosa]